jgi:hypothetical protein
MPAFILAALASVAFAWLPAHSGTATAVRERWRAWPVGRIFPDSISGTSPSGAGTSYRLTGVAPEAPCERALHPAAARALASLGCLTTLRATYADSTETFVATAGIAVLSDAATVAASPVARRLGLLRGGHLQGRPPSVRPARLPGGVAEEFGERQYIAGALTAGYDRYVVLTAAGYADGRPYVAGGQADARLVRLAGELAGALYRGLTR